MAKPYLIVTSEKVSKEYLDYLDRQNISWIACVKEHVDLVRATEILAEQFGVERMSIVGGPKINTAFLEAGLLDEISLLSGAGIDVFENEPPLDTNHPLLHSKNTIVTPHIAFASAESMEARAEIVFQNIKTWLEGKQQNIIL